MSTDPTLAWLRDVLDRAGRVALTHFGRGVAVRRKADHSPVTDADLAAEAVILAALRERFPEDTVVSEETHPGATAAGGHTWYVDPIDGTSAFTEGLAHWGPTVARVGADGTTALAGTWLPRLGELTAIAAGGAWSESGPLRALATLPPPAVVYLPSAFHRHFVLRMRVKGRCLGGTAAHLALVARGSGGAAIVAPGWRHWDTAAGLALIEAVGGRAVRLSDGSPLVPHRDEGVPFVAGFAGIVDEIALPGVIVSMPPGAPDASA